MIALPKMAQEQVRISLKLLVLIQDTEYYVRAYATNALGTQYGNEFNFTTQNGEISLSTNTVTNTMALSATSGGDITSDGGSTVSVRGVVWSTNPNPTLADNFTEDGAGHRFVYLRNYWSDPGY
jgi:hypothetical protein